MLDKLIQAAIITFLLHLLLLVSSNSTIPSTALPSLVEKPNAIALKYLLCSIPQRAGGISQQLIANERITQLVGIRD
ncbi:hypothetical protein [Brunnivagina elsteri]|uniref:Uncharacterized protein n=1 Tax=Brunnivagina elsteri CCALA 953 TaxID=987040 RepID=A0A2A2TNH5_9CYAN|nr:hypothetical protein [Calothrix elsteri]PAX60003.1 hypothetical protein CK510_04070 [Calothrix elsteri CCALA 953]